MVCSLEAFVSSAAGAAGGAAAVGQKLWYRPSGGGSGRGSGGCCGVEAVVSCQRRGQRAGGRRFHWCNLILQKAVSLH